MITNTKYGLRPADVDEALGSQQLREEVGPVMTDAEDHRFIDEMAMKYRLELPTTKRFVTHEHADVR